MSEDNKPDEVTVAKSKKSDNLDPEKYYERTKKLLQKKYLKMNLSKRIRKLKKKISTISDLEEEFRQLDRKEFSQMRFYTEIKRKAFKMLDEAYLYQFLNLDLTEDTCRLLMCVAQIEFGGYSANMNSSHTYKNVLLDHVARNNTIAKKLTKAYNDILFGREPEENDVRVTFTDDEDKCVTFASFPSISYISQ